MKGGLKTVGSYGFTIVELMIVLAVTGFLLLMALIYVGGQQNTTEFNQAIYAAQDQIQTTINDVIDGYYPDLNQFTCSANGASLVITSNSTKQGQNLGCIFFGKAIQFGINDPDGNQDTNTYTIVGSQCASGGTCQTVGQETYSGGISTVLPTVLKTTSGASVDESITQQLEYGLYVTGMCINSNSNCITGSPQQTGVVAFSQSLTANQNDNLITGPQQVALWSINNTTINNMTEAQVVPDIDNYMNWNTNTSSVEICLASPTINESGLITIGYNSDQLGANLKLFSGSTTCV